jgi:hypothetical protein
MCGPITIPYKALRTLSNSIRRDPEVEVLCNTVYSFCQRHATMKTTITLTRKNSAALQKLLLKN